MPYSGIFEVNCSKDIKVQGIIGPCASLEKVEAEAFEVSFSLTLFGLLLIGVPVQKGPLASENVIGQGNTTAWKMCGLDKTTSLCLIFDIVKKENPDAIASANNQFYFQFLT